jgi:hypothetical protein
MQFWIFHEHQLPRPWEADAEYTVLQQAAWRASAATRASPSWSSPAGAGPSCAPCT